MDVREKLIDLLTGHSIDTQQDVEYVADHLISNGVMVQEWISINERLPEEYISVLGYMTDAGKFPPVRECYRVENAFFFPALKENNPISYWCEMPQPPKGCEEMIRR